MDEVDVLLTKLQFYAPDLIPTLYNNNDEHRVGHTKFVFPGRGILFNTPNPFYRRALVVNINDGYISLSISNNVDGVIFIDHSEDVDMFAPEFMLRIQQAIKSCSEILLRLRRKDEELDMKLNNLVGNR